MRSNREEYRNTGDEFSSDSVPESPSEVTSLSVIGEPLEPDGTGCDSVGVEKGGELGVELVGRNSSPARLSLRRKSVRRLPEARRR